jgi:hypothetical protein
LLAFALGCPMVGWRYQDPSLMIELRDWLLAPGQWLV